MSTDLIAALRAPSFWEGCFLTPGAAMSRRETSSAPMDAAREIEILQAERRALIDALRDQGCDGPRIHAITARARRAALGIAQR